MSGRRGRGRTLVAGAATMLAALAVAACGGDDNPTGSGSKDSVKVGVVLKAFTKDFWRNYSEGAESAKGAGVEVEVTAAQSETDVQGQIAEIEDLLTRGVDALVVAPISEAAGPTLDRAKQQGVPVLLVESTPTFDPAAVVSPDPVETSADMARYIVDKLGKDIQVGILTAPGIPIVEARLKGAKEAFAESGVEVVATLPAPDCERVPGLNSMQDMLQAHPDVDAVYATCSPPDLGAITAVEQAGLEPGKDVHVYGYNGDPPQFEAIQAGTLEATVDQQPAVQGEEAVKAAAAAARGKALPREVFTKAVIVDQTNVAEYAK